MLLSRFVLYSRKSKAFKMPTPQNIFVSGASEKDVPRDGLTLLAERANKIIFEAKSVFPFELFPDKITICLNRVTVSYKKPFYFDERPLPIEFINTAHVTRGAFFASLSMETFGVEKPAPISHLRIDDAREARRYILALVECKKNNIDFSTYDLPEIKRKLQSIGRVRE